MASACWAADAPPAPPLRVHMMASSLNLHRAEESLAGFAEHLRKTAGAECTVGAGRRVGDLEGLERADVLVIYCRYVALPDETLKRIQRWRSDGKPVIAIRPSVRAFTGWPKFCADVLGCDYKGHPQAHRIKLTASPEHSDHPVLRGVKPWTSEAKDGMLYQFAKLADGVKVLLSGEADGKSQPVAWVRMPDKTCPGRVFYTSLGLPEDFANENFKTLLTNAVLWSADRTSAADDWPQFGGPRRDFSSAEKGLARSWAAGGPKVLWSVPLNPGFGGAATAGQHVFVLDRNKEQREALLCLELASGRELWRFDYDAPGEVSPPGTRCTPTIDQDRVYITGPLGQMHCVERATGKLLWKTHLVQDFEGSLPKWGVSQSPVVHDDLVIVAPQGRQAGLVAFQKETGKVAWKSPMLPGMITGGWQRSYVSPVIADIGGVAQVIMVTAQGPKKDEQPPAKGVIAGISLKDGAVLWSYDGWQCVLPISAPLSLGDGRIFVSAAYDAGSAMIRVRTAMRGREAGAGCAVEEVFQTTVCGTQIQQPLLYKDHLYVLSNGKERKEGLMCLSLDGTVLWHTTNSKFCSQAAADLPNLECGNILLADGMIYALDGATGDLRLVEASPKAYKELAIARGLLGGEDMKQIWAPMALSGGKLLARDQKKLICVDVSAGR